MGRSHVQAVKQPDELSCGPATLQMILRIFDIHAPMSLLYELCRTNSAGTNTRNMIRAIRILGFWVQYRKNSRLTDMKKALAKRQNNTCAVCVPYLYGGPHDNPKEDSGHWATVASLGTQSKTITLFDSYEGKRKTYFWRSFRSRWWDYSMKKRPQSIKTPSKRKFSKQWKQGIMITVALRETSLPSTAGSKVRIFPPLRIASHSARKQHT